ncbi:MAG: ABC transporter substrate-binding protein [Okeania sp. SIO2C2]|uniref:ABC transporter substrate-binding protein n=1 Tax=Okeania sp. SIO2C2 TaxID=2607787 RepID=UPI0013BB6D42|nr:ABC transporter substrate-binding protein [Okeania sp. SIO2C2]NEP89159.1 ABC transporter substrate-binding protein [Okeania sp. SIO2C2]
MTRKVVIKIEEGSFELGFPVSLEFWQDGRIIAREGKCPQLPPNPDFPRVYDEWRNIYTKLGGRGIKIPDGQTTNVCILEECQNATLTLESNVRNWLGEPIFGAITARIIGELQYRTINESVRVIIDTSNDYLRKLSWDYWDLFEKSYFLPQAEFALLSKYNRPTETLQQPIQILAIFGSDEGGLQLQQDRELIENLNRHGARITSIPARGNSLTPQELFDTLWLGNWDIIFYAGHSSGQTIHVDHALNLSIDLLKEALRRNTPRVKLAIFNSCDGLGIAEYLADFNIPHLIVMREPVPDIVARRFLQYFLEEFTQGKPLHTSVREARKHLQQLEYAIPNELFYPRASRLPVLIQNPATPELYWPQPEPEPEPELEPEPPIKPKQIILFFLAIVGVLGICRWFYPKPETLGDNISKGEEILVKLFQPRDKQRGVDAVAECQKPLNHFLPIWYSHIRQQWSDCFVTKKSYWEAAQNFQESWKTERRDPETLIYLNNAFLEATGVDYYTITVVVPVLQDERGQISNAEVAEEILRGVAQAQTEVNLSLFKKAKSFNLTLPGANFLNLNDLNGKGLKVIIANDANLETQAKKVAQTLVKRSDILGVIASWTSEMTMATVDIYNQNQLVSVSPGAATSELTDQPRKFFFRIIATNHLRAEAMVDVLMNKINQNKATIFYNPASPYSSDYKKHFKQKLSEKGGYLIDSFDISRPNFNAKNVIQKVRKYGNSAIVLVPDGQVTDSFAHALKIIEENDGQNWIVSDSSIYSPKTLEIVQPQLLEKLMVTVNWHHLNNPKDNFAKTAKELWGGSVSDRTALSYDTAQVLIKGIEENGEKHRREIKKILAGKNFRVDGVTGEITFQPGTGDRKKHPLELVKVVRCDHQVFNFVFIPEKYSKPEDAGLNCSISK